MKVNVNLEELENFLEYLEDKAEDCYKKEVKEAIKEFIKDIKRKN